MACQIFETSAKEADCISYTSKILVSTSLPCRNLNIGEFSRNNGHTRFTIHAPIEIGIPYGTYPRLLLIWIVTEAKKHKTREIYLGETVTEFIRNIGKAGSGGKTGSLTALREQAKRLFTSTITTTCNKKNTTSIRNLSFAKDASIIWKPNSKSNWSSTLTLSESFYEDISQSAIPIDMRVVQACSHYPLAIDIYCWLTYRNFGLKRPTVITWQQLASQFGNTYSEQRHFKHKFLKALYRVHLFYPDAKFMELSRGLCLYPSPTHIPK